MQQPSERAAAAAAAALLSLLFCSSAALSMYVYVCASARGVLHLFCLFSLCARAAAARVVSLS